MKRELCSSLLVLCYFFFNEIVLFVWEVHFRDRHDFGHIPSSLLYKWRVRGGSAWADWGMKRKQAVSVIFLFSVLFCLERILIFLLHCIIFSDQIKKLSPVLTFFIIFYLLFLNQGSWHGVKALTDKQLSSVHTAQEVAWPSWHAFKKKSGPQNVKPKYVCGIPTHATAINM